SRPPVPGCARWRARASTWARNWWATWAKRWRSRNWWTRWHGSPRWTREPAGRAQSRADPVHSLVPDPGRAVLDLSSPAARHRAPRVRRDLAGAGGGGVRLDPVLVAGKRRPRIRPDVGTDPRQRRRIRRLPGRDDARFLSAAPDP